jgi:hypothetical protein
VGDHARRPTSSSGGHDLRPRRSRLRAARRSDGPRR